ncbi:hypothetical protein [Runella slithyformis]|uniref:Uncharacterized protein n=1 Tax=Runella slithyformis (strain ATCC 29530 / DSM 19594 / LMG 11500 / NCIMB 11436 / LSU 4) TaxID=761193 RepID=A0A7U3ZH24_RUNSL|nr:hypothetical protein [Runella slithyformis]AEI47035.1 hypothetical protein Runsl_0592 [Runella slithyformis DSM 19594]
MIYSLQRILVLLFSVSAFVYTKANQGVHVRYLTLSFVIVAVSHFLQTNSSGLLKASFLVLAVSGILMLRIPSFVAGYVRSLFGFQNAGYLKGALIAALRCAQLFSYLYVVGLITGVDSQNSGLYVCALVGGAVYNSSVVSVIFPLKKYADWSRFAYPLASGWLKSIVGYLLFMPPVTVFQVGILHFFGENSTQYVTYEWFYQATLLLWLAGMIFLMVELPFVLNTLVSDGQVLWGGIIPLENRQDFEAKIRRKREVGLIFPDSRLPPGELVKRIRIGSHRLSHLINSEWNMDFNEFIHSYRIIKAQKLFAFTRYL